MIKKLKKSLFFQDKTILFSNFHDEISKEPKKPSKQDKSREKNINKEKRKRFQIYTTLDYLISMVSYFDFFSTDTFQFATQAKYLALIEGEDVVRSEFLLYSFLDENCCLFKILKAYNLTREKLFPKKEQVKVPFTKFLSPSFLLEKVNNKLLEVDDRFYNIFGFSLFEEEEELNEDIADYSYEVLTLFEKACENAIFRFKTPVITPELLFITMMEEKETAASKIIRKQLNSEVKFYTLRYELLKVLHKEESYIKRDIKKNYLYFAYLLKTQLSHEEFERLCENNYHALGVLFFRNELIEKTMQVDLPALLEKDIAISMKKSKKRFYS